MMYGTSLQHCTIMNNPVGTAFSEKYQSQYGHFYYQSNVQSKHVFRSVVVCGVAHRPPCGQPAAIYYILQVHNYLALRCNATNNKILRISCIKNTLSANMHIQLKIACSGICGGCFMNLLFPSFSTGLYMYADDRPNLSFCGRPALLPLSSIIDCFCLPSLFLCITCVHKCLLTTLYLIISYRYV